MVVVRRGRKLPWLLREKAADAGVEPMELVAGAIRSRGTFGEAADDLGVSLKTLRRWRAALAIEVE